MTLFESLLEQGFVGRSRELFGMGLNEVAGSHLVYAVEILVSASLMEFMPSRLHRVHLIQEQKARPCRFRDYALRGR